MQAQITAAKERVRSRIRRFYESFGKREWGKCYEFVDPELRDGTVNRAKYVQSLSAFFKRFGPIAVTTIDDIEVFSKVTNNPHDGRDFAYAVVVWQDKRHERHLLRERWVKSSGHWYSRRVGLVIPEESA